MIKMIYFLFFQLLVVCAQESQASSNITFNSTLGELEQSFNEQRKLGMCLDKIGNGGSKDGEYSFILVWNKCNSKQQLKIYTKMTDAVADAKLKTSEHYYPKTFALTLNSPTYDTVSIVVYSYHFNLQGELKLFDSNDKSTSESSFDGFNDKFNSSKIIQSTSQLHANSYYLGFSVPNDDVNAWRVVINKSEKDFLHIYNSFMSMGIGLSEVRLNEDGKYYGVFSDHNNGQTHLETFKNVRDFTVRKQYFDSKNFKLKSVDTMGSFYEEKFRIVALFEEKSDKVEKSFSSQGMSPLASLDKEIEKYIKAVMTTSGAKHSSIAIIKDSKLIHAKAYNSVYPKDKIVNPHSPFRIASLSKPITAMAIMKLKQEGKLSLEETIMPTLQYVNLSGKKYTTGNLYQIRMKHLIGHSAGWDRSMKLDLPDPINVAEAFKHSLPVTSEETIRLKFGEELQFAPGGKFAYSNMGYSVLGRVIEKKSGKNYETFVRQNIFYPLDLSRPSIAASTFEKSAPHEPAYIDPTLRIESSRIDSSGKPMLLDYGGEFDHKSADSFGGWRMRPVDYAKFLAAIDAIRKPEHRPATLDVLNHQTMLDFLTPIDPKLNKDMLKGFFSASIKATDGKTVNCLVSHGGALPGASTLTCLREDGVGYVVFVAKGGVKFNEGLLNSILNKNIEPTREDLFEEFGIRPI